MKCWTPKWWCYLRHAKHRGLVRVDNLGDNLTRFVYLCEKCSRPLPITRRWRRP